MLEILQFSVADPVFFRRDSTRSRGQGNQAIFYRPQTKFAKVMFLQVSVCPQGGCVWLLPGGHAWLLPGGHVWLLGGVHGCSGGGMHSCSQGACVVAPRGACMVAPRGGVRGCSGGACMVFSMRYGQ